MGSISLVSLNVERSKHLDRVVPFVQKNNPDVFCVQELSERDLKVFENLFPYHTRFTPHSLYADNREGVAPQGICIFSQLPITESVQRYYVGDASQLPTTVPGNSATYVVGNRAVVFATVEKAGVHYRIGSTHFTWSERGQPTDAQRAHLSALLNALSLEREFVLAGDFNLPRGGELFEVLAGTYTDNIPLKYKTSIDLSLHRNSEDDADELSKKMVDGLFTTPEYSANNVRLVSGVSDHMAIVATVEKS